jgi:hypothetical protein
MAKKKKKKKKKNERKRKNLYNSLMMSKSFLQRSPTSSSAVCNPGRRVVGRGREKSGRSSREHTVQYTRTIQQHYICITVAARERTLLLIYIPATKKKVAVQKEIFKHRTKGNERRARGTEKS